MKKTKKRALYIIAALLAALFVLSCLAGFAACGGGSGDPEEVPGSSEDDTKKDDEGGSTATVSSVSVNPTTLALDTEVTKSGTITATVTMSSGTYTGSYSWSSDNTNVATVSGTGATATVTAVAAGTANVTVTVGEGTNAKTATCVVTVTISEPEPATVSSVSLSSSTLAFEYGSSSESTLTATVTMSDGSDYEGDYAWSSTDTEEEVVKVTGSGASVTVTPVFCGTATITVTVGEGDNVKTDTCTVTVSEDHEAAEAGRITGSADITDEDFHFMFDETYSEGTTVVFDDSAVSAEYNAETKTYTLNGISGVMDETQGPVFSSIGTHVGCEYVGFIVNVDQGETVVAKSYSGEGATASEFELSYGDDTSFLIDLTNHGEDGAWYMELDVTYAGGDKVTYTVVFGDIFANPASTEEELTAAVAKDGEVTLTADIALTSTLTIGSEEGEDEVEVTLDLNGNTLSTGESWTAETRSSGNVSDVMISVGKGANLTIEDTSEDGSGKIDYSYSNSSTASAWGKTYNWNSAGNHGAAIMVDGDETTSVTIESGDIETTSVGIRAKNGDIVINGGTIHSTGFYVIWEDTGTTSVTINDGKVSGDWGGILVDGDSNFKGEGSYGTGAKTTLTVNGGKIYSGGTNQAAIRTENKTSTDSAYIEINGGKITCADNGGTKNEAAIYLANGTLKVTDGVITGPTALEVQAGKATVEGGKFVAKYGEGNASQNVDTTSSSSDPFTYGYSLAVYPRANVTRTDIDNFSMAVDVTVTGGTFDGDVLVSEVIYGQTSPADGWILNATDSNYKVSISGITATAYSEAGIRTIVAFDDSTVILGNDIALSSTLEISTTVTLDLNGYTLSANGDVVKVTETGNLTVEDSSYEGSGEIKCTYSVTGYSDNYAAIKNSGVLEINGGKIYGGLFAIENLTGGTLTVNGGTIGGARSEEDTTPYMALANWGEAYIYGGKLLGGNGGFSDEYSDGMVIDNYSGKLVIGKEGGDGPKIVYERNKNSTWSGNEDGWDYCINIETGEVTINGGTITCNADSKNMSVAIYLIGGTLTVNGGTIEATEDSYNWWSSTAIMVDYGSSVLTINGGTLSGTWAAVEILGGTVTVNGGTFVNSIIIYTGEWGEGTLIFGDEVKDNFDKTMYAWCEENEEYFVTTEEDANGYHEYTQKTATDDGNGDGGNIGDTGDDGNGGDDGGNTGDGSTGDGQEP